MLTLLIVLGATLFLLYRLWTSAYNYWTSRGYPQIPGEFPFGTSKELVTLTRYQGFIMEEFYHKMAKHPFFGIYFVRQPILVLRDLEMVKLVVTKEFSHFRERLDFQRPKEFLSQHLFNLDGDRWRTLRVKLSPTFTSGKLKGMFPLFVSCAEALDNLLISKMEKTVNIKDITSSYTADTICSCAFGIEVNGTNPDSEFKKLGFDIFNQTASSTIKIATMNIFPFLKKFYVPRFAPLYMEEFLLNLVTETIDYRQKNGVKRNDFLELLIQMKDQGQVGKDYNEETDGDYGTSVEINYKVMAAQCFVFFAAGFETASAVQNYCLYEMALNPDIQERVHQEIIKTIEVHGGVTYQAIMDMPYLDLVISETMRKYPTLPILTRVCNKAYKFPTGQIIEEGTKIMIPVYALHRDPALFPNPEKFDPERFAPENKNSIKPYSYLPFGEGPRNCIGMRFGLVQAKMGVITILRKYLVGKTDETPIPIKFKGTSLISTTDGPIQLKLTGRKHA